MAQRLSAVLVALALVPASAFMSSPYSLATQRLRHHTATPATAQRSASTEILTAPAMAVSAPQRRSVAMSNQTFSSVARAEKPLLEELKNRDVFGGMPSPSGGDKNPNFEPNLGKVVETLREDYPTLLDHPLDYSIYTPDIILRDPSGVVFKGIGTYKRLFAALRWFRSTLVDTVETRFRITYDWSRQRLRVNWHLTMAFRARPNHPIFVDCISVYHINDEGLVKGHDLETILINGEGFASAYDLQAIMGMFARTEGAAVAAASTRFLTAATTSATTAGTRILAATAAAVKDTGSSPAAAGKRGAAKDSKALRLAWPKVDLPSGCEDSWDCESPMTCCDFALFKVCCNQGMGSPVTEPRLVPIPIPVEDYPEYPRYPDYY